MPYPAQRSVAGAKSFFFGQVLLLPPGTRRPDYYTLLGLPFFKSDPDSITAAAAERIRKVQQARIPDAPEYREAARELLREILVARETLLDDRRRRRYDDTLIRHDAGPSASPPGP